MPKSIINNLSSLLGLSIIISFSSNNFTTLIRAQDPEEPPEPPAELFENDNDDSFPRKTAEEPPEPPPDPPSEPPPVPEPEPEKPAPPPPPPPVEPEPEAVVEEEPEPPQPKHGPAVGKDKDGNPIDAEGRRVIEDEHVRNRRLLREKVEENQNLKASGHVWQLGAWMYGDLEHGVLHDEHLTAHGCADHCEANPKCFHWVFYLESGRCDFKTNGGSLYSDTTHMIVGHAKRYLDWEKEEKERRRLGIKGEGEL